jgi:hypothetical protein
MTAAQCVDGAPDSILYAYQVATLKSLLAVIEHANITSLAEIDIDTLLERMHAEAREHGHVVYGPRLVSAWSRKPDAFGRQYGVTDLPLRQPAAVDRRMRCGSSARETVS